MTISSDLNKHVYDGNGVTINWPYTFQIILEANIKIYLTSPTEVTTLLTANYEIDTDNSRVVYPTPASLLDPLPTGWNITLVREEPFTQETDLKAQGPWSAEVLELAYDKLTMLTQQLKEITTRCIKYAINENPTDTTTSSFLSSIESSRDAAGGYAAAALVSQNAAAVSAGAALVSQNAASGSASAASGSATAASNSAIAADSSADAALVSQNAAASSANDASASEIAAAASEGAAAGSAGTATTQAGNASSSASAASGSAGSASTSAGTATTQAGIATTQAGIATTKAGEAAGSAVAADNSADAALISQNAASGSASAASGSAATATTKASDASGFATAASGSASDASGSAATALGHANDASGYASASGGSASAATTQAGNASTSATNANNSAIAAAASAASIADPLLRDHVNEATAGHGTGINGAIIKGGTNTFSVTNGTASLDVAAGATLNVDANLTVETASAVNQDLTTDASPTFANVTASTALIGDTISEKTAGAGVTVDGLLIKDGGAALEYHSASLATTITQASYIEEASVVSFAVTLAGTYLINAQTNGSCAGGGASIGLFIKTGSATYASATLRCIQIQENSAPGYEVSLCGSCVVALSAGDTVHLGVYVNGASGNRVIKGDNLRTKATAITAVKIA